jgi:5-formyltetrahydrofolate cyclo-ligase
MSGRLPGTVAAFLAMAGEVDLTPLFDRLPGWRWVLPRVEPEGALGFRDRDVELELHRWGMSQPVASGAVIPVHEIDLLLVPGLAFDRSGARLGRGGGFYDRLLAQVRPDVTSIGVTQAARLIDTVPVHDHDRRVDMVVTEDGLIDCSPTR